MKYFNTHDVPFMFDPNDYRIFMFIGDHWVEIVDSDIENQVRFDSTEITKKEVAALIQKNLAVQVF
jgi:hypothetical protein